ncbi:hypothetical protein BJ322DRAFT_1108214 [Thelephora terrestris]|uniref:Uncharacterized protein n=1 Tax=Thelephora terrestris TaxID=56493 RepID=A0A9P6HHZ3_9AGAM|nr:hypothetical protein BJ322DRAFT_1108214 [Thelephora terrestris]
MSSFLDDIIADTPNIPRTPLILPAAQQNGNMTAVDSDDDSLPDTDPERSQDNTEDQETQTGPQNSPNDVSAFAINAARNLRLTADGENSLIQFSQLDTRLALIYQQATLIKMSEAYSRLEHTTTQGSQSSDELVLTKKIMDEIDYRARLIMTSPDLSRYRALGKDLKTGPGAIIVKWLRTKSGINKQYFEGEAYKTLRAKVKSSCRYARSDVKDIRRAAEEKLHITDLLKELTKSFEKWFRNGMRTSLAIAVRFALLRQVYDKDPSDSFWKSVDKTLADIRQMVALGNGLNTSEILVKCLDADEQRYPPATGSTSAQITLASVRQSEDQLVMNEFVSVSDTSLK